MDENAEIAGKFFIVIVALLLAGVALGLLLFVGQALFALLVIVGLVAFVIAGLRYVLGKEPPDA